MNEKVFVLRPKPGGNFSFASALYVSCHRNISAPEAVSQFGSSLAAVRAPVGLAGILIDIAG
jgi:hypothetical protein